MCAINPQNGPLYSTTPSGGGSPAPLLHYRVALDRANATLHLPPLGAVTLRNEHGSEVTLQYVQGGAFSLAGHLYLSLAGEYGFAGTGRLGWAHDMVLGGLDRADMEIEGLAGRPQAG